MTDYLLWLLDEEEEKATPQEEAISLLPRPLGKKPRRLRLERWQGTHGEKEETALPQTLKKAQKPRLFYFLGKRQEKQPSFSMTVAMEKEGQKPRLLPQEDGGRGLVAELSGGRAEQAEEEAFLTKLQAKRRLARYAQQQGGRAGITLPEMPKTYDALPDLLAIDRGFQRDARRYDGGFSLY